MLRRALLIAGTVTVVVGACLDRRGLGDWDLDSDADLVVVAVTAAVLLAGALSLAPVRNVRVGAAILATLGLVGSGVVLGDAIATGLPGPSSAVLAVGVALVGLAAIAGGFVAGRGAATGRRVARGAVALLGAGLLAAGAAGAAVPLVVEAPVSATTAPPVAAAPEPVPARPGAVAWEWRSRDGVRQVERAGRGVVVATNEGVTALDGASGLPRWSFARAGASVLSLLASPDGATVLVVHGVGARGDGGDAGVLTVLDAATGEHRFETGMRATHSGFLLVTDHVVIDPDPLRGADDDIVGYRYTARDLATGAMRWTRDVQPGCASEAPTYPIRSLATVPVFVACSGAGTLQGLRDDDGATAWTVGLGTAQITDASLTSSADGTVLGVVGVQPQPLVDPRDGAVRAQVPQATGFVLLGQGAPRLETGSSSSRSLAVAGLDPASGTARPLPPASCPLPTAVVTTAVVVQACPRAVPPRDDGLPPTVEVTVDTGAPLPAGPVPQDPDEFLDRSPVGVRGVLVVPAPGAWAVAPATSGYGSVVGLR